MDRIKELIEKLNNASKEYYQNANSIISDFEYDKLYNELEELEKETGIILSSSPTQNVGFEVLSNLQKVKHESRMLSLDKTKEVEKLKDWLSDYEGVLSWKLDGLTIILKYENGELIQAITRGNGEIGEDITHNAKVFKNVPLKIAYKNPLTVRGEGVISYSEFEIINSFLADEEKYKNPRNLCSGTVRQLNNEIAKKRNVMFYGFAVITENETTDKKTDQGSWLKSLGFDMVESVVVTKDNIENEIINFQNKIKDNDFATDGLVLTFNSISYGKSLGTTSKFPKDSIAFKWADEKAETVLREIDWSTSRTGLINPVAVFDAVELEGTTVNRASVHNISILKELKLGIGDVIKVYKANMIIPQIAENLTCSDNVEIPENCKICNGKTEIRTLKEGEALYCTNPSCEAQIIRGLSHFASRDAMNIEGLSEETIKKFVEKGFLHSYVDIFKLENFEEIKEIDGFGERSFTKLVGAIEKSKNVMLPNAIYALGINQVGLSNAKLLCKYINYDVSALKTITKEELTTIDGFGEVIGESISSYFSNEKNIQMFEEMLSFITFEKPEETENNNNSLEGLVFVVTGDVNNFKNRKELQSVIEGMGGKVTGSVTSKTNYLINNDIHSGSGKNKKAKELGVSIITENDFIDKFME